MIQITIPAGFPRTLRRAQAKARAERAWWCVAFWADTGRLAVLPAEAETTVGFGGDPRSQLAVLAVVDDTGEVRGQLGEVTHG